MRPQPPDEPSTRSAAGNPAELFELHRPLLLALAYRLLGSMWDAEDVVQEGYLRWTRADRSQIRDRGDNSSPSYRGWRSTNSGRRASPGRHTRDPGCPNQSRRPRSGHWIRPNFGTPSPMPRCT